MDGGAPRALVDAVNSPTGLLPRGRSVDRVKRKRFARVRRRSSPGLADRDAGPASARTDSRAWRRQGQCRWCEWPRMQRARCGVRGILGADVCSARLVEGNVCGGLLCIPTNSATASSTLPTLTFHAAARPPAAQSCPRRRPGVACDERATDAVGNLCSAHGMSVFVRAAFIEPGTSIVSNVSHSTPSRGGLLWLDRAMSSRSARPAVSGHSPSRSADCVPCCSPEVTRSETPQRSPPVRSFHFHPLSQRTTRDQHQI